MNEKYEKIKGHFTIQSLDKDGNVLDEYKEDNLIMDTARTIMAERLSNIVAKTTIDKIVIGTEGHKTGDILTPKDSSDGFVSSRTQLFSEESADYNYSIGFTVPGTTSGAGTSIIEADSGSSMTILQAGNEVTYAVDFATTAANDGGTATFTEAALYAGTDIFSMKTFKAKVKDASVTLRIIWKIIF